MTSIRPLLLVLLLACLSFAACDEADLTRDARPTTLAGTAWRVVSVNNHPPVVGSEPTAVFAADQLNGSAGCNSYGGQYTYDPSTGAIALRELSMTAMGCLEPGRSEFEGRFSNALTQATSASIDPAGRLVLTGPGGQIVLAVDAVSS
jgi:heat shock protein HslJ